jgi:hypothetical protein
MAGEQVARISWRASLLLGDDVNGRNQRDYGRIVPVVAGERGGYVGREEPVCVQAELSPGNERNSAFASGRTHPQIRG